MAEQSLDVLVVEDATDLRESVVALLLMSGFRVREAATVAEGVSALITRPPDIILSDLMLPDGAGFAVIDQARELNPAPPVLVMTAFGTLERAVEALKHGAYDFLLKPFTPAELTAALARAAAAVALRRTRAHEEHIRHIAEVALTLAHEINNPLAVLLGELMLQREAGPDALFSQQSLRVCIESGQRIAEVVRQIAALRQIRYEDYAGLRLLQLQSQP
jgi:DNA-binding response OmpR family regulator